MRIIIPVIMLMLITGCSGLRKGKSAGSSAGPAAAGYGAIVSSVLDNNITLEGFEIRKGSIELEGTEIEGKFGLHARLNNKGDFYCSVRGPLGIELVRLLIVGNDIAAIDRINRKIYIGKKDEALKKNGMPEDFMTIIFGDMPTDHNGSFSSYGPNTLSLISEDEDFRREILVCTDVMKICSQKIDATISGNEVYMSFGNFVSGDTKKYASEITLEEKNRMFHVKLSIDDLIFGYDSDIEFNLPSYRRESL